MTQTLLYLSLIHIWYIDINKIDFAYPNSPDVLHDVSLQIHPGEPIALVGPSGGGKTTLSQLIPRFYDVTEGEIRFKGVPIKNLNLEELRRRIGVVPQKAVLFKGMLRENMKWGKKDADDTEIRKALEIAQAAEIVEKKRDGLDTVSYTHLDVYKRQICRR